MRNLWGLALAAALAACGGTKRASTQPEAKGPCEAMADHAVKVALAQQQPAPSEDTLSEVARVVTARCETDKWSPEAQGCMAKAVDHKGALECMNMLTGTQREAVEHDVGAVMERSGAHDGPGDQPPPTTPPTPASAAMPSAGAPPPAPPPPARGKGAADKNKKTSDPCDGGQ